jgi:hypothetical protein
MDFFLHTFPAYSGVFDHECFGKGWPEKKQKYIWKLVHFGEIFGKNGKI